MMKAGPSGGFVPGPTAFCEMNVVCASTAKRSVPAAWVAGDGDADGAGDAPGPGEDEAAGDGADGDCAPAGRRENIIAPMASATIVDPNE